jgi:periplasmic protein CpxP/Spy
MQINRLLVISVASVLIGGGGFITSKALADGFLTAQNAAPSTEQRQPREGRRGGGKFERLSSLTEAQKNQLQQIKTSSRQQIEAIPTAAQKARMQAIRNDARTKMEAILTAEQRQQLQQSPANGERKGWGMPKISGLTDAQKNQMKEIRSTTRQQMDAVLTADQKNRMEAIRTDTKAKMDAVLTAAQRQELEQMRQQKKQNRQQRQS